MNKLIILTLAILIISGISVKADYYPEPTGQDTLGIYEFFNYTNYVSGYPSSPGLMFPVLLLVLWVIIFTATKRFSTSVAFTTASAMVMFFSIPLTVIQLVSQRWMYIAIIFTAVGAMWRKLEVRSGAEL